MSKKSSVIEINGKRYDAITGKLIGAMKKVTLPAVSGTIDGFTKAKYSTQNKIAKHHPKHSAREVHKRAQKGKTLMREAVRRPAALKGIQRAITSKTFGAASPSRLTLAAKVHKNPKVNKFNMFAAAAHKPSKKAEAGQVLWPAQSGASQNSLALSKPLPSMVTSVSHHQLERLLDEALAKADSHKQMLQALRPRSFWQKLDFLPKWLSASLMALLVLVACGLFAWQKVPQISLKLAAGKAKINASVPAYKPAGFALKGPVKYQSGTVVVNYGAEGNQNYTLTQQASDWDSVSLAANSIPTNTQVQTSQIKGTTVYIYGPHNDAAWVSNGIRYTIKDAANLSSDQIIKIADSL